MDCSPPGSSVHEIFQARILAWVAISFSRGSSQPRGQTRVCCSAGRFFTDWATREAQVFINYVSIHCSLPCMILAGQIKRGAWRVPPEGILLSAHQSEQENLMVETRDSFSYLDQSVVPCPGLPVASWPAYRFLKRQVRWSGIPISWRILSKFFKIWILTNSKLRK